MSWFRSSRRRRSPEPVEAPAGPPRPRRGDIEGRPLADLHALAAEWGVPRFRLLRREQLVAAISGDEGAPAPEAARTRAVATAPAPEPQPEKREERQAEEPDEPGELEEADEPQVPAAAATSGELRTGIVDLVGEGYGFVRVDGLARSRDDPYLSRELVRQFGLRRGEEVSGRVAARRAGERQARMVSVAGRAEADPARPVLDEMPVTRPSRPLRAPAGDAFAARMVEIVAPLAAGHRVLVAGPPGAGATHLLRDLARGLAARGQRVIVALVDARPEEVPEWQLVEGVEVHAAGSDRPPRDQVALAELALERGKRLVEGGVDAAVVLDSISRLARAYGLARARANEDAPTPELLAVEGAKRWFAAARDTGTGALTLLTAGRVESESPLEGLVHETLADAASVLVRLDPELAARGMFPALDFRASRTLGEESLIAEHHRAPLEGLRGVLRSLGPAEAWEFAAARVRDTSSNDELLEQSGAGQPL